MEKSARISLAAHLPVPEFCASGFVPCPELLALPDGACACHMHGIGITLRSNFLTRIPGTSMAPKKWTPPPTVGDHFPDPQT